MLFVLLIKIHIVFLFRKLPKLIDIEVSNWLLVMEHFIHFKFVKIFLTWNFHFSLGLRHTFTLKPFIRWDTLGSSDFSAYQHKASTCYGLDQD